MAHDAAIEDDDRSLMFESEEPEDWHKKFHHDMALNNFDFIEKLKQLEKNIEGLKERVGRLERGEYKIDNERSGISCESTSETGTGNA